MKRWLALIFALSLEALACSAIPGLPGTTEPGALETSAAATLTALAPTVAAPTEAPTTAPEEATATATAEAPAGPTCSLAYADGANLFCLAADGTPQLLATAP